MPIHSFRGKTFVAFTDISGFKEMMKHESKAADALNNFYSIGFQVLINQLNISSRVEGIFISDCGILFVRRENDDNDFEGQLLSLLTIVEQINRQMLEVNIMLTTSIAYGEFSYQERFEFSGIEKNAMHGNGYLTAFMDNEVGKPRIQPGQCRIVKQTLPNELNYETSHNLSKIKSTQRHLYYYWMVNQTNQIEEFEQRYNDSYSLKYSGMMQALKGNSQI